MKKAKENNVYSSYSAGAEIVLSFRNRRFDDKKKKANSRACRERDSRRAY